MIVYSNEQTSIDENLKRRTVTEVFNKIASRYDLINRLISLGLDPLWRKQAVKILKLKNTDFVLDIGCGTGDMALMSKNYGCNVIGLDPSFEMLKKAKMRGLNVLVCAEVEKLPFKHDSFSAITTAFTIRNFSSIDTAFSEINRVLLPLGKFLAIDIGKPDNLLMKTISFLWFSLIVPQIGSLFGDKNAYDYLKRSFEYIPSFEELRLLLIKNSFKFIGFRKFFLSHVYCIWALKRND